MRRIIILIIVLAVILLLELAFIACWNAGITLFRLPDQAAASAAEQTYTEEIAATTGETISSGLTGVPPQIPQPLGPDEAPPVPFPEAEPSESSESFKPSDAGVQEQSPGETQTNPPSEADAGDETQPSGGDENELPPIPF